MYEVRGTMYDFHFRRLRRKTSPILPEQNRLGV